MADADILELMNDAGRRRDAFDMIAERYQQKILRLAFAILGERTSAEDAAQDALLRIWRSLDKFRGESSLSTWIYSIARNAALSARKAVRESQPIEEPGLAVTAPSHATPDLMGMVEALPEQQRRVVILFYLEGKSYVETAALLDLPMGTVKTYLYRARKELALAVAASSGSRKMSV